MSAEILLVLSLLGNVALVVALWRCRRQRALANVGQGAEVAASPAQGTSAPAGGEIWAGPQIRIRILNPITLAERESRLARLLSRSAPGVIRRIVYERVAPELSEELAERGVEVQLRIDGLRR